MADVNNPEQLFAYKLGVALSTERTIMSMLRELEETAHDEELRQLLSHHRDETEQQISNLEQAFSALGTEAHGHRSPTIDGIKTEGREMLEKVDEGLADSVILGGTVTTEHHEISLYEALITQAAAMGEEDVVALLQENLEQEQHTLQEVERKAEEVARASAEMGGER